MASTSFFLSRNVMIALLGTGFSLMPAAAAPICKPVIGFKQVRFSEVQRETMERIWSATLSVEASRCATTSGHFQILFSRSKENAPEDDVPSDLVDGHSARPDLQHQFCCRLEDCFAGFFAARPATSSRRRHGDHICLSATSLTRHSALSNTRRPVLTAEYATGSDQANLSAPTQGHASVRWSSAGRWKHDDRAYPLRSCCRC